MQVVEKSLDELLSEGFAFQQAGEIELAKACYETVIAGQPTHVQALHLLGILHALTKNFPLAIDLFSRAIERDPDDAQILFNRANVYYEKGQIAQSLDDLELALSLEPDNVLGLLTQGNAYIASNQQDKALICFDKALALSPKSVKALNNRGLVLTAKGFHTEAFKSFAKAIANDPLFADGFNNLGILLLDLGHLDQAVSCFEAAISLKPQDAVAYNNLGNALNMLARYGDALKVFEKAIALKPDYAQAHSNLGSTFEGLRQMDEAIQSCEVALQLDSQLTKTHNKLAVMLKDIGDWKRSLWHLDEALRIHPDFFDAMINKGNVLSLLKQFEDARACFDHVLSHEPSNTLARWNKSLLCLQLGDYENGWKLYEAGWAINMRGYPRELNRPLWLGRESLAGKTILLHAEQGLGDTLQFCRYAAMVKHLGARVLLEVPEPLLPLMQDLDGIDECVVQGQPLPEFDFHCPLMSLPLAFETRLQTIPSAVAYLKPNPQKVLDWSAKVVNQKRLKVGIVWNGGFRPHLPHVWSVNQRRNVSLGLLSSSLKGVNADFYSLQKGEPAESEIRGQEELYWPEGNFINLVCDLHDFSDTAALIANLDVVISVDTSTAHLAAAIGKPTWLLSRYDNCWRWLEGRTDSPWYPTLTLYRQGADRNWVPTLARLADDLRLLANDKQINSNDVRSSTLLCEIR